MQEGAAQHRNTKPLKKALENAVSQKYKCPFPYRAYIHRHTAKSTYRLSQSWTLLVKSHTLMLSDVYTECNTFVLSKTQACRYTFMCNTKKRTQPLSASLPPSHCTLWCFCKSLIGYKQTSKTVSLTCKRVFSAFQGQTTRPRQVTSFLRQIWMRRGGPRSGVHSLRSQLCSTLWDVNKGVLL